MDTSPQPWFVSQSEDTNELVVRDADERIVAAVEHWNAVSSFDQLKPEEIEANAELIANAPKLRDLAESLIEVIDDAQDGADMDRFYEMMTHYRDDLKRLLDL